MKLDRFMVGLTAAQLLKGAAEAYAEIQDLPTGQQLLQMTDRYSHGLLKRAAVSNDWDVFNRMVNAAEVALRQANYEQRCEMWNELRKP